MLGRLLYTNIARPRFIRACSISPEVTSFLAQQTRGRSLDITDGSSFPTTLAYPAQPPECRFPAIAGVCSLLLKDREVRNL